MFKSNQYYLSVRKSNWYDTFGNSLKLRYIAQFCYQPSLSAGKAIQSPKSATTPRIITLDKTETFCFTYFYISF